MRGRVVGTVSLCLVSLAVSACALPPSAMRPSPTPAPDPVEVGQKVYLQLCAQCHGEQGEGYANELAAPALDSSEHAFHHADQEIYAVIVNGKQGLGREMPAYGDQLTGDQACSLIVYLHTLWSSEHLAFQQELTSRWPATASYPCEP